MERFIGMMAIILILAYVSCAIWFICKRQTIGSSIGASVGFLCGGFVIIPIAEVISAFVCWSIVIVIFIAIIGAVLGR